MGQKYLIQGGNKERISQVPILNKVSFGNPFEGNAIERKLTAEELVRGIRFSIAAEYEAIQLYTQLAEASEDKASNTILMDIVREEKVHVGELLSLLKKLDPEEATTYQEGENEIKDIIGKLTKK